ncbi:11-beta-hydroxysteroid dehydrogenase-like 4A [Senna tora]|uniref:11-beta-hydroxysteroid dehydrogenase-like 4A n=1 Tax=Senna tora TaxID=362788 RepID=A0A834WXY1_9FABA|nr:11-beta-hydroxysteroid dehydrogenase-like 4A [Senna tora]
MLKVKALAYEYARRGARLALVARREDRLRAVLQEALRLGAPDAIIIPSDVSNIQHSHRFIQHTINHFGQLDHLVNNAGTNQAKLFEEYSTNLSDLAPIMASKAAMTMFFETLRVELGEDIGITIVAPGIIESEMSHKMLTQSEIQTNIRIPVESREMCAKAIIKSACRGDLYLIEPSWARIGLWAKWYFPALVDWCLLKIVKMPPPHTTKKHN